jgi:peroxiredoxin
LLLTPRRSAHLGLGATIFLTITSLVTIFLRPLTADKPIGFAEPGAPAPLFKLSDGEGRSLSLHDLRGQVAILYFTSIHCPDCARYNKRVEALAKRYRNDPRVRFVAINIDRHEDPLAVRVDAKIVGRTFPTLCDTKSEVATLYSIKSTPQIAIVDPQGSMRYWGPFDDNSNESEVTQRYVADTLATILANPELAFAESR